MNIVQITPGAGKMYCGACFRDNALVARLRQLGHSVVMLPLYLPITLDEDDQTTGTPIFFSGINVYLEQKSSFFRTAPHWLHDLMASPALLNLVAGSAGRTQPQELGEMTLSMLRGEEGNQARELDELIAWLKKQPVQLISLSDGLLVGMVRRLKAELRLPVVCTLQGEDVFLDSLPEDCRAAAWELVAQRAAEVDYFIAPSRYFADLMTRRLRLRPERMRVVHNGINLQGYGEAPRAAAPPAPPALGFFARMCPDKGLGTLVDAYVLLKRRDKIKDLRLRIGGSCGPLDKPYVEGMRRRLAGAGLLGLAEFRVNLSHAAKIDFLRSLTVLSTPANYGEAFGLYVIEALAAGVPVVLPAKGSFPELVEATGGGMICAAGDPLALAEAIEGLLLDPSRARALGEAGQAAVHRSFSVQSMADQVARVYAEAIQKVLYP